MSNPESCPICGMPNCTRKHSWLVEKLYAVITYLVMSKGR